jgi:hypothetical protein
MQDLVRPMEPLEEVALGLGKVGHDSMQEERGLVEQAFRRLDVLEHHALGHDREPRFLVRRTAPCR